MHIPSILPVASQAEEHTNWVFQSAVASSNILYAILAVGAASLLALDEVTNSGSTGSPDANDRHGTIPTRDAIIFKIIAVKLIRSGVEGDAQLKEEFLLYSVMCLMVTEVIFSFS